ncbi:MAG TPA: type 1 glutamine amidotransferase [Caulobacteraceae bacterium]|nr:type 1 glutamine amidotransferase [Caulobacteraceae bacterium]
MFQALIGLDRAYRTFDVAGGDFPSAATACDAYIVTGSEAGVYDDRPWIAPLLEFLRAVKGRARLVGVCFGHQAMAEAFGGRAIKSPKGLAMGLHTYAFDDRERWMDSAAPASAAVSHQDQVVELPPGAHVVGGNAFTPMGVIAYGDQPAISMQCHPEFMPAYAQALLRTRWAETHLGERASAAIAELDQPNDHARLGGWIRRFLDGEDGP